MIAPDNKNWTWVIDRRCDECGFDASICPATAVPALVRRNADEWRRLADAASIRPGRPDVRTWSTLEYACHVRDVYRRYDERLSRMLAEDDPLFQNWDQDASAVVDGYDEQDPSTVVGDLVEAARQVAGRLGRVTDEQWSRPGRRSDGASFTVDTISRYMIHDTIHHIWDVSGRRA